MGRVQYLVCTSAILSHELMYLQQDLCVFVCSCHATDNSGLLLNWKLCTKNQVLNRFKVPKNKQEKKEIWGFWHERV